MPDSFQALSVALIALLPGAGYTFAFERVAGSFGVTLADRLIRFLAASAVFHAAFAGPEYAVYRRAVHSGDLAAGRLNAFAVEVAVLSYVLLPIGLGALIGHGWLAGWRWVRLLTRPAPASRAWDYFFSAGPQGYLRAKLKSGPWVGGFYGTRTDGRQSYAAGYPAEQDLLIARRVDIDPATGIFLLNEAEQPRVSDAALLVRWSELELLEFTEVTSDQPREQGNQPK